MKLNKLLLTSLFTTFLCAEEFQTQFNYFGNITASMIDKDGYKIANIIQTDVEDNPNIWAYSKIGGQVSAYKDNISLYAQAVAYKNEDKKEIELTWLNGKYQISNEFSVKVGRMQHSLFLNSRSIDLDYVHTWIKPPVEIYFMMPLRAVDGVEFTYEKFINDYYVDLRVFPYAKAKKEIDMLDQELETNADDIRSIALEVQKDNITLKTNYSTAIYNLPSSFLPQLEQFTTLLSQYGNDVSRYSGKDKRLTFLTLGLDYNYEKFTLNSEYLDLNSESLIPNVKAYYALMSYKLNKYTPYIMFSKSNNEKKWFSTDDIVATDVQSTQAKYGLETILYNMNCSQETRSVGLRYDYKKGIAFKAQVDRITYTNYGTSYDTNPEYVRRGFTYQENGFDKSAIYQFTMGMSFAF